MDKDRSFTIMLRQLFLMSLSLTVPLILIGASSLVITIVTIIVFATALSGSVLIAYVYRLLHNIILRPGLYIWALIVAISGAQDIITIGFYIVFVCQLKNIIANFIGEIMILSNLK